MDFDAFDSVLLQAGQFGCKGRVVRVRGAQRDEPGVAATQRDHPGVGRDHLIRAQRGGEAQGLAQAGVVQVVDEVRGRPVAGRFEPQVPRDGGGQPGTDFWREDMRVAVDHARSAEQG